MTAQRIESSNPDAIDLACACLERGELIVIPTDTVYGLAAHAALPEASTAIVKAKGRPSDKPLPLLISDASIPTKMGAEVPPAALALANAFWPGPLTLVLKIGSHTEGFRVPDHPIPREIAARCGGAIRVTSANRSGQPPALSANTAASELDGHLSLIIDDGPAKGSLASSVVLATHEKLEVLREGAIPMSSLTKVMNPEGIPERPV